MEPDLYEYHFFNQDNELLKSEIYFKKRKIDSSEYTFDRLKDGRKQLIKMDAHDVQNNWDVSFSITYRAQDQVIMPATLTSQSKAGEKVIE